MILRNYQEAISTAASQLLKDYQIAYLSMQVRTGKTITSIAAARKYGASKVLFVTKKKAIDSILSDYHAIGGAMEFDCINYEQLHNYIGKPDLVILDEAHCLGQYPRPAERTKLLKEICAGLPLIFLSGTPSPESYSQLYHQLWVSSYSPFSEWPTFYKWAAAGFVYLKKKYHFGREYTDYKDANQEKVEQHTSHLFLSYTQAQAGFSQQVKEEVILLRMQPSTYYLADRLTRDRVFIGKDKQVILADTELKLMQKLHQIYSGTVITEGDEALVFDRSKANFIREHFKGKKIAIFYKYRGEGTAILWEFGGNNLTTDPQLFNASDDLIFYSQIQSGREGINLSTADAIIMYNIDYSSVSYQQARARLLTKDRQKEAVIYWLFAEGGIEPKIYKAVQSKQDYTLAYFKDEYLVEYSFS